MICLDNDVFSRYASRKPYPSVDRYLAEHAEEPWALPSVVLFECLNQYDAHDAIQTQRRAAVDSVDVVLDLDADVAAEAANIDARLSAAGTSLDGPDLLIAATARANGAVLATRNRTDFDKKPIHELMRVDIVEWRRPGRVPNRSVRPESGASSRRPTGHRGRRTSRGRTRGSSRR